jgi:hypothetical protein
MYVKDGGDGRSGTRAEEECGDDEERGRAAVRRLRGESRGGGQGKYGEERVGNGKRGVEQDEETA